MQAKEVTDTNVGLKLAKIVYSSKISIRNIIRKRKENAEVLCSGCNGILSHIDKLYDLGQEEIKKTDRTGNKCACGEISGLKKGKCGHYFCSACLIKYC